MEKPDFKRAPSCTRVLSIENFTGLQNIVQKPTCLPQALLLLSSLETWPYPSISSDLLTPHCSLAHSMLGSCQLRNPLAHPTFDLLHLPHLPFISDSSAASHTINHKHFTLPKRKMGPLSLVTFRFLLITPDSAPLTLQCKIGCCQVLQQQIDFLEVYAPMDSIRSPARISASDCSSTQTEGRMRHKLSPCPCQHHEATKPRRTQQCLAVPRASTAVGFACNHSTAG